MEVKKRNYTTHIILLFSMLFMLHSQYTTAQNKDNITISATTPLPIGEKVRLLATDDYITNKMIVLCESTISNNHTFQLSTNIKEITLTQMGIRTSRAEFYIVPNWNYSFNVEMDTVLFKLFDPGAYGGFLQIQNLKTDTNDINLKINYFLAFYEAILQEFSYRIVYLKDKECYDTVVQEISKRFPTEYEPTNFYKSYIYYTIAQLDKIIYSKYPDKLYEKYFNNEYVLYNNPAYMHFFKDFYSNYLYASSRISQSMLNEYINTTANYPALFNEVGRDHFLVNERLRELVILYNLWEFTDSEDFNWRNVISLIEYIAQNTHFPEHKKIADNILEIIQNSNSKKLMSEFIFKDEKNKNVKINKLKGKWVYLHFYDNYCDDCIREMLIIKELHAKFKDEITFVSVSLDLEYEQFKKFREAYPLFDWEFVHFNDHYDWLIAMDIFSLPENIILNKDGEIEIRHAPDPDKNLFIFLEKMFHKEEQERINPMFYNRSRE
ncbi:TlpA family protein disulfide reductase [Bacteroidales bacterium OttesenSCG-928-B11]|nr:TlpA family protein disulfide reductase [Bacteroidales bacterium OttesenSCG-928-B11]MDL2326681.1 TlpA family protein disulfide reductase [Bacteroidales bacterium OttesenSCG-928-A14]